MTFFGYQGGSLSSDLGELQIKFFGQKMEFWYSVQKLSKLSSADENTSLKKVTRRRGGKIRNLIY